MRKHIYNKKSIIIALFAVLSLAMCLCAAVLFGGLKTKAFAADGQDIDDISAYTLADYVTVQNKDVGAEESFSDGGYNKYYSFPTPYSTSSMVYRFKYTPSVETHIALRDTKGGWINGYRFIFTGNKVKCFMDKEGENAVEVENLIESNAEQIIEIGAIDTTTEGKTYIYVKINGELKIGKIRTSAAETGCGFGIWGAGGSGTFKQVDSQSFKLSTGELERYVTVQNRDVGAAESFSTADSSYKYYSCVTPTTYATNSMVYRFKYTPSVLTYVALRATNGGWNGYQFAFNDRGKVHCFIDEGEKVIDNLIDSEAEQTIELGAIDFESGGKTFVFVKINGELKISAIRKSLEATGYGFAIWGAGGSGTFKQVDDKTFPSSCFENYEVVTNEDFGSDTFTINGNDGNARFRTFVKETANATTSVVYKFNYTHLGGATYIAMRDNGSWGGYQFIIDGNGAVTYGGESAGSVPLQTPCNYELGAIDLTTGGTYVYAIINGEKTFEKYVDTLANTGCGFSIWASDVTGEFGLPLCDYVTFQNLDAGAPVSFKDGGFNNRYVYETTNDTSSAVYKFRYTPSVATFVAFRNSLIGEWGNGYRFIFVNGAVQYYTNNETFADSSQKTVYNVMSQDQASFLVEIGAIDVENRDLTLIFVKIDGVSVVSEYVKKLSGTEAAFGVWGESASSGLFEQADLYSAYGGKNISVFEGLESATEEMLVNDDNIRFSYDDFGKKNEFVFNVKPYGANDSAFSYNLYQKDGADTSYLRFLVFFNSSATLEAGQIRIVTTLVNGTAKDDMRDLQDQTVVSFPTKSLSSEQSITIYTKVSYDDSVLTITVKARDVYGKEAIFCNNSYDDLSDESKEVFNDTCGMMFWASQDAYICDASKYITVTDGNEVDYINYIRAIELVGKLPEAKGMENWEHVGYRLDGERFSLSEIYPKFLAIDSMKNHTLTVVYESGYTFKDESGNSLGEGSVEYGKTPDYDVDSLTNENSVFVGFLYNGKLYRTLDDVLSQKVDGNAEITLKTVALSLEDGASIKLVGGEKATIKFSAKIDKENADNFVKNFGMLFTTSETLKTTNEFTLVALGSVGGKYYNINKLGGMNYSDFIDGLRYSYSIYLDGISLGNYGLKYTARAYVVVEYADGTEEYVYTPYSAENNARSVYQVATAAMNDDSGKYDGEMLKKYIDGVIDLDTEFKLIGYERDYSVDVVGDDNGNYTVTVTPKNGFDVRKIGSIYVDGEYIPAKNAAISADGKGTFVISEDDMSSIIIEKIEQKLIEAAEEEETLEILAYEGPQMGVKFNSNGVLEFTGTLGTLADLEEYMAAGFDSWIVIDASYGNSLLSAANGGARTAKGTVITGGHPEYDIYWALDLAAEYANKHKKPCKVYVTIPSLVSLDVKDSGYNEITEAYKELIGYVDKYNGNYSPVNGKNQLAGFLLKDEPTISEYDDFAALYSYIAYSDTVNERTGLGALAAGYDFECALLQSYTVSDYIGGDFNAYVKKYAELLKDTTISFDNYPFNYQSRKNRFNGSSVWSMENSWFFDMQTIRSGNNKAYGTCIQSYVAGEYNSRTPYKRVDKEEEISMQVYTALAYGFTKLNYFTYWQRNSDNIKQTTEVFQNNMVRWNDYSDWSKGHTTTALYNYGKNVNEEAKSLFNVLKYFTNNGVQLIVGADSGNNFGSATTTNASNPINNVTSSLDMVVGGFKCGAYNGYLAVNVDLPHNERTAAATFNFGAAYTKAVVYENGVASVKTLKNGTLSLDIGCGEGVFIIPIA